MPDAPGRVRWRCGWCGQESGEPTPPADGCQRRSNRLHRWDDQSGRGVSRSIEPLHWHGQVFSRGDQSYGHLAMVALQHHLDVAAHLREDHGIEPSDAEYGSWCRDVETHAAAHDVIVSPT